MDMKVKVNRAMIVGVLLFGVGIMLRYYVMSFGSNFDFESYTIVGELASHGKNIYAETSRYNYAFLFSWIQGFTYFLADLHSFDLFNTYRILMVSVLTLADLGIAMWLGNRYSLKLAIIFFLNPISIIITGYHNQFDNIAILFALLSISFHEESEQMQKRDWIAVLFLSLSLLTKHILFMFFAWILFHDGLRNKRTWGKRLCYCVIPPLVFLCSFIPYALQSKAALQGILDNVFFYRSYNNSPLLALFLKPLGYNVKNLPYNFLLYAGVLLVWGLFMRKASYEKSILTYFIGMVAFSSAIANQYLIIPIVGLLVLDSGIFTYLYMIIGLIYCFFNTNEFGFVVQFEYLLPEPFKRVVTEIAKEGGIMVSLMTLLLCCALIRQIYSKKEKDKRGEENG